MTTTPELTDAERALAEEVRDRFGWNLVAPKRTVMQRLTDDRWLRSRPEWSAGLSFVLTAGFAGLSLHGVEHRDLVVAVVAYLAGLAAALFGAFEVRRAVSAGQGGAR